MRLLALLLLAAPLAAQEPQTIVVPNVENNINIQFDSLRAILEDFLAAQPAPMSDSVRQANFDRNMEAFRELLAEDDEEEATSTTTTIVNVGRPAFIVLLSLLGLRKLGQIVDALEAGAGKDGQDGQDGTDGTDGTDGEDGSHDDDHDDDSESGEGK